MFIALATLGKEFSNKILVFNALAPIAYLGNQSSILLEILVKLDIVKLITLLGIYLNKRLEFIIIKFYFIKDLKNFCLVAPLQV